MNIKLIIVFLMFIIFSMPIYASEFETIVSVINVNDIKTFDIELMLLKKGEILIPFKSFSELFNVQYKINHKNHNINFSYENKTGEISTKYIKLDGKIISKNKNYYLKKGLIDETIDEIFCHYSDLEKIFNSKIKVDKYDMSIILYSDSIFKIVELDEVDEFEETKTNKIRAYKNVLAPKKDKKITFDTVVLNNNTVSDTINQYLESSNESNFFFNNNSQIALLGKLFDGEYKLDFNTYSFKDAPLSFGGIGFNYKNRYKNFEYELGKPEGIIEDNFSLGSNIYGFQIRNYLSEIENYKDIDGYVDSDSIVKVYFDDNEIQNLSTYDGYYSLNGINSSSSPKKVKIVEIKKDNSEEIVLEKELYNPNNLKKGDKKFDIFAGVSGYNNRLFTQNNYVYKLNTKKYTMGGKILYGVNDNVKLNSKILVDKIYSTSEDSFFENIYSSDALLTSGTYKNSNNQEGITKFDTIYLNENMPISHKLDMGYSVASDKTKKEKSLYGYNVSFSTLLKLKKHRLKTEIFNISPDFYMASSNGSYINDRLGCGIKYSTEKNGYVLNSHYNKYYSNLNKEFDGGLINFNEYNLSLSKNYKKLGNLRFNINGRDGSNSIATNSNYYYNLYLAKQLNQNLFFEIGKQESNYRTKYKENFYKYDDFKSIYSTIYANFDYKLPKNFGSIKFSHDITEYSYNNQNNKYNMAKIGYTFREFKNVTLSLNTGYKYKGLDNGFDFGINMAIRAKSGRIINIGYQYNKTGGYLINNMYVPLNDRHSINITINDAFKIMPRCLKSVGNYDDEKGYIEAIAYIDKNNNKKFDRKDIKVKNVPIKFNFETEPIYTNSKGRIYPSGVDSGIYYAEILEDKLPVTLFQEKTEQMKKMVRVDKNKVTRVEFPVKSCVGNVSGKLVIKDEFNRNMDIKDFIIVLLDKNNNEKAYSTVNSDGEYYLSGIEPGEYIIKVDDSLIEDNNLVIDKNKELRVNIPYKYKKFIELKNMDLNYSILSI